jgi:EAL domain-containing protein (putative c-di-GMP-specific phosphodiesterase class I)
MKKDCIHCGLPFELYEKGYLFVQSEKEHRKFTRVNGHWLIKEYKSVGELESLLNELIVRFQDNGIQAGIAESAVRPLMTFDLSTLISRIQKRETVKLINHGRLVSYLQPIISLKNDGQIYGYESLLRTETPELITPGELFGTANETGLLSLLDKRAREAAIKAKKEKIPPGIKSFINFLPSTIYNPAYCMQHTFRLVEKYQIDPDDLVFEVVESEKIEDIQHLRSVLSTYKKQGMKVALDDVGTGFSTLEVLELLNPDYVKIDRQYIDYCDQDAYNQEFLGRVIELAKKLEITVLAEGIERQEELDYCRKNGIDLAQGFFIGKPSLHAEKAVIKN